MGNGIIYFVAKKLTHIHNIELQAQRQRGNVHAGYVYR